MNESPFKTLHLTLWQTFTKKSFIIQFIVVIYLVSYCRNIIAIPPLFFLMRLGAIIGLSFLLLRPIYGLFVIIFFIAGFLDPGMLPLIPFFRLGSVHITDAILGGLFFFIIVRKLYYRFFYRHHYPIIRTPIDIPLILFFIACVIALINGIAIQKADFNVAFRTFRYTSYYLLFFLITNLIRNKRDLTLFIRGVFFIALITSIVTILQSILGTSLPIPFIGRVETLVTARISYEGVTRSISSGLFLIYLSFISLGCIVVTRRLEGKTILWGISVIIFGLGLLFTFYRVIWITSSLALLLFIFLAPIQHKGRFISYFLVAICMVIVIFLFSLSSSGKLNKILNATQERITSIFKVRGLKGKEADTLSGRTKEIEYALLKIKDHPILGIGLGTYYKPIKIAWYFFRSSKTKDQKSSEETSPLDERLVRSRLLGGAKDLFATPLRVGETKLLTKPEAQEGKKKPVKGWGFRIGSPYDIRKIKNPVFHNSILDVVMRLGLVGLIPFIWLFALPLIRGFRYWKIVQDPFLRILSIGLTASFVGIFMTALLSPILLTTSGSIPIPIIWGINEVIYRLEGIEEKR
ncbi:MAG: O-antigen ligase family protein [Proteobacteria bacterium]|nr:O-antigen ligase family protein [Pseudomonadota bacterium]